MGFDWGSFFASSVKEAGTVAKAKDVSVAAEAKAQAEEFADKQEAYEDEVTKNKRLLREEADSIRGLGIKDIGKIRTVMNTYGNADVMNKIREDFKTYQSKSLIEGKKPQFNTLEDYIKGRITGAGTTMISDESAEQASDEAAIAGDELDIQKAEQKAKAQGISLDEYLQNQAVKMSDRPAFNLDARAARLVEESKAGIFGKTLTLEEAKKQILGAKTMEGAGLAGEAKDLGETGFALSREGGLSAEERIKLEALRRQTDKVQGKDLESSDLNSQRNDILKVIKGKGDFTVGTTASGDLALKETPSALKAFVQELETRMKGNVNQKSKNVLQELKDEAERKLSALGSDKEQKIKKPKPPASAIRYLRNNPDKIDDFIKRYGEDAVPSDMKK